MYFIELIPFLGLALAAVDGESTQEFRSVKKILDSSGSHLLDALNNANATGRSQAQALLYNEATTGNSTRNWRGFVEISVTEDFSTSRNPSNDSVQQITAFSIKAEDGSPASEQSSDICFTVIDGMSKEATEEGQKGEKGACDMIPLDCQEELALRLQSLERGGCQRFVRIVVPEPCTETFPDGFITTYSVPTRELEEDGYFYIHNTSATTRGSKEAEAAHAELREKIWPVYLMTSRQTKNSLAMNGGKPACLRASQLSESKKDEPSGKTDGNDEKKEDENKSGEDEETKKGAADVNGFSTMGIFAAALVALVAAF